MVSVEVQNAGPIANVSWEHYTLNLPADVQLHKDVQQEQVAHDEVQVECATDPAAVKVTAKSQVGHRGSVDKKCCSSHKLAMLLLLYALAAHCILRALQALIHLQATAHIEAALTYKSMQACTTAGHATLVATSKTDSAPHIALIHSQLSIAPNT